MKGVGSKVVVLLDFWFANHFLDLKAAQGPVEGDLFRYGLAADQRQACCSHKGRCNHTKSRHFFLRRWEFTPTVSSVFLLAPVGAQLRDARNRIELH